MLGLGIFRKRERPVRGINTTGHIYSVRVEEHPELSLVFDTRAPARRYRDTLRESRRGLKVKIFLQVFQDGLQVEEREIW